MKITKRCANRLMDAWHDRAGIAAVEFALILPLMLLIFFGGYVIADAVMIKRKVAITSRTVADLATQVASLSTSDMSTILATSSQVLAPYSTANLSIRLSEIIVDATGTVAKIAWSASSNTTELKCNASVALPMNMYQANAVYVLSQVNYNFTPIVGVGLTGLTGTIPIADTLYMIPRVSSSVSYPCPD